MIIERSVISKWFSKRYLVVFLTFLGYINLYTLRVNLSVAIVAMTDPSANTTSGEIIFDWDSATKGIILGSFFYGYIFTQFIGGLAGTKFGGNIIFGGGIAITAVTSLFIPLVARHTDAAGLIVVRVIQGLAGGLSFPCCHAIFAKWAPVNEKSRMASFALSGYLFGTVVANMTSGVLSVNYGWESVFYVFGAVALIWYLIFVLVVRSAPDYDKFISPEEKNYIITNRSTSSLTHVSPPWKSIFTSVPVYAVAMAHFSSNWGFYTLLTQLPSFLKDTLNFELKTTGFVSALPYLALGTLLPVAGYLADFLRIKEYLTMTQVRKYFTFGSFFVQGSALIIVTFLKDPIWTVAFVTISVGAGAFSLSGFMVNPLDIAPQYASILLGLSNTSSTIPGIVSPLLVGLIVTTADILEWRTVFFISSGFYYAGAVLYFIFASGEIQQWAIEKPTENTDKTQTHSPTHYHNSKI